MSRSCSTDWLVILGGADQVCKVILCKGGHVTSGSHSWKIRNISNLIINFRGWGVIQFKKFLVLSMNVESESSGHVSQLVGKLVTKC